MTTIRSKTLLRIALLCFLCIGIVAQETQTGTIDDVFAQESLSETINVIDETAEVLDLDAVEEAPSPDDIINIAVEESIAAENEKEIKVKSNLESMTDAELQALCKDRGFDVAIEGGGDLTHEEYVEAAKRCLSLEDEMNAILAENPDLAAELEDEIERMRLEKVRLEQERDAIMAEKEALEEKLRRSGVDPSAIAGSPALKPAPTEIQSVDEVLRESFVMLFDRVGRDMRLVGRALRFVLRPAGGFVQLVWRYASPSIEGLVKQVIALAESVLAAEQFSVVRRTVSRQCKTAAKIAAPVLEKSRAAVMTAFRMLNQREEIRKVGHLVEAFFGPLSESLLSGWRSVKPGVVNATTTTRAWIRRLNSERAPQDTAQQIKNSMRNSK